MQRKKLRKLQADFFKEQEQKRKEESEQVSLWEEVFSPIRKLTSKFLKPIIHSKYKYFLVALAGIVFVTYLVFQGIIFVNDSKEAIQPDDNKPFQESVVEIKEYFIKENKALKEEVEKEKAIAEDFKTKYEEEKKEKEEIQAKYELLQTKLQNKQ